MVAHLFDERDGAVERMVTLAIEAAHRALARRLASAVRRRQTIRSLRSFWLKISSTSLHPDTMLQTTHTILEVKSSLPANNVAKPAMPSVRAEAPAAVVGFK